MAADERRAARPRRRPATAAIRAPCRSATVANGRVAMARSATHGAFSKTPPSAATKASRSPHSAREFGASRTIRFGRHVVARSSLRRIKLGVHAPAPRSSAAQIRPSACAACFTSAHCTTYDPNHERKAGKSSGKRSRDPANAGKALRFGPALMARLDALGAITEVPGQLTRRYLSPAHVESMRQDRGLDGGGRHERAHRPAVQPVRPLRGQDAAARPPS